MLGIFCGHLFPPRILKRRRYNWESDEADGTYDEHEGLAVYELIFRLPR